ncbi:hypothetical protein DAMA08_044030 [Martiniozyma asiatica (nom. inval.)]|nr:hypothetical protein DAMA08_044030 [Martiniozyma asiatica]
MIVQTFLNNLKNFHVELFESLSNDKVEISEYEVNLNNDEIFQNTFVKDKIEDNVYDDFELMLNKFTKDNNEQEKKGNILNSYDPFFVSEENLDMLNFEL